MVQTCCVVGCKQRSVRGCETTFHSFPKPGDTGRRDKWISQINRAGPDGTPWSPTQYDKVCSDHFLLSDFVLYKRRVMLKPDAFPSLLLGNYHSFRNRSVENEAALTKVKAKRKSSIKAQDAMFEQLLLEDGSVEEEETALGLPTKPKTNRKSSPHAPVKPKPREANDGLLEEPLDPKKVKRLLDILIEITRINIDAVSSCLKPKRHKAALAELKKVHHIIQAIWQELNSECQPAMMQNDNETRSEDAGSTSSSKKPPQLFLVIKDEPSSPRQMPSPQQSSTLQHLSTSQQLPQQSPPSSQQLLRSEQSPSRLTPSSSQECASADNAAVDEDGWLDTVVPQVTFAEEIPAASNQVTSSLQVKATNVYAKRKRTVKRKHRDEKSTSVTDDDDKKVKASVETEPLLDNNITSESAPKRQRHSQLPMPVIGTEGLMCEKCGKNFKTKRSFWDHCKKHKELEKDLTYTCDVCNKEFKLKESLRYHKMIHQDKRFQCTYCGRFFIRNHALRVHMRNHTGEKPFQCQVCKMAFVTARNLKIHERIHTGEKPYQCHLCEKAYHRDTALNKHVRRTHSRPALESGHYKCEICGREFDSNTPYKFHMMKHAGEKPYQCTTCDKTFSFKTLLLSHLVTHSDKKLHVCTICNKSFKRPQTLRIHMSIHNGTQFSCSECNKNFSNLNNLNRHKSIHLGLKPFQCTVCGRCFNAKNACSLHMWTHRTDKRYRCEVCGQGYNDKRNLVSHRKTHQDNTGGMVVEVPSVVLPPEANNINANNIADKNVEYNRQLVPQAKMHLPHQQHQQESLVYAATSKNEYRAPIYEPKTMFGLHPEPDVYGYKMTDVIQNFVKL